MAPTQQRNPHEPYCLLHPAGYQPMNNQETHIASARTIHPPHVAAHHNPARSGKIGWALLWLLGIPLPVLLIIYLIKG